MPISVPFDVPLVATAVLDVHGTVVGWTQAAEELLGYPAAEVLGKPAGALLAEPCDTGDTRPDGSRAGLLTVRHSDGHPVRVGVQARELHESDRDPRWLVSAIDLDATPWWGVSRTVLERFLSRSPFGMAVMDTDLRYVWLNQTLERMAGVSKEERLGRRMSEVLPELNPQAVEEQMRHVLETGEAILDFEYSGYTPADPDRAHAFSTSFFRLDDGHGRVMGVCYMGVDVTDRWRARERLALLTESGGRIGSTLDISRTAQELASVAVPWLADFVAVDLLDSVLEGEEPSQASAHRDPALRRVAQQSVREGCPESVVSIGEPSNYTKSSPAVRSLAEGRAILEPILGSDGQRWLDEDTARARTIESLGIDSVMVVPVRARGVSLGVAVFARRRPHGPFHEDDLRLAEEFVSRAAVSVDNARRYTRERAATLTLQQSLLPQTLPATTAVEVASRYLPANAKDGVGGDWFDVIELSGARVALVVGDVVGHGMNAAATMGRLRAAVHTLADMELPPDELLARLDDLVIRLIAEDTSDEGATARAVLGATCLCAVYDPVTQRCVMARAGHLPPVVVDPSGRAVFPDLPAGPPLGLGSMPFESTEIDLPAGSLFVLYTDGLVESPDADLDAGLNRLTLALNTPELPLENICDTVLTKVCTPPQTDDLALLVARAHALGPEQVVSFDLDRDPAVVAEARAFAARTLGQWDLDALAFTTELIVSELVTNAIRHASGPIRLRLIRHSVLICEVSDGSSTSPHLRHARVTDEGGRGLFLVAQTANRWGTRYTPEGKIIWSEQALPER